MKMTEVSILMKMYGSCKGTKSNGKHMYEVTGKDSYRWDNNTKID